MSKENLTYSDISKERRNLMTTSIALSLFMIAGGSIDQIALIGGAFKLQRPNIIYIFAWISLYYFYWRYWLYSKPDRGLFRREVYKAFIADTSVRSWLTPIIDPIISERSKQGIRENMHSILQDGSIKLKLFKRAILAPAINSELSLPYFKTIIFATKHRLLKAVREKTFSDYLLPYWLFLFVNLIGFFKLVKLVLHRK